MPVDKPKSEVGTSVVPELPAIKKEYISATFDTDIRRTKLKLLRRYIDSTNKPPFPGLDKEDSDGVKRRVAEGIARGIIIERVGLLLGRAKFAGAKAIEMTNDSVEKLVKDVWEKNKLSNQMRLFHRAVLWAGCCGWKFVVDPTQELKYRFNLIPPEQIFPRFKNKDDQTAYNISYWDIMYKRIDGSYYLERIGPDYSVVYEGILMDDKAVQDNAVATLGITNPIEFVPVIVFAHQLGIFPFVFMARDADTSIFGESLIEGIIDRIDRVNEILVNSLWAMRNMADPIMVIRGAKKEHLFKDSDAIWFLPNKDGSVQILTWEGVTDATYKMIEYLVKRMHKECAVPLILNSFDQNIPDLSSRALEIIYTDAVNAIEGERDDYETMFKQIFNLIVKAAQVTKEENIPTDEKAAELKEIRWGSILPVGADNIVTLTIQKYSSGLIDQQTALAEMGYQEEKIKEIMQLTAAQAASQNAPGMDGGGGETMTWAELAPEDQQALTDAGIDQTQWETLTLDQQKGILG